MNSNRIKAIHTVLIVTSLLAYILAWVINNSSGLTLGAYDLASWANLHPTGQDLWVGGLLRFQLVIITTFTALLIDKPYKSLFNSIVLLTITTLIVAQLPAPDFIDANARQQLIMAALSLILSIVVLLPFINNYQSIVRIGFAVLGIVTSIWGFSQASDMMRVYGLPAYLGGGIVIIVISYLLIMIVSMWQLMNKDSTN